MYNEAYTKEGKQTRAHKVWIHWLSERPSCKALFCVTWITKKKINFEKRWTDHSRKENSENRKAQGIYKESYSCNFLSWKIFYTWIMLFHPQRDMYTWRGRPCVYSKKVFMLIVNHCLASAQLKRAFLNWMTGKLFMSVTVTQTKCL